MNVFQRIAQNHFGDARRLNPPHCAALTDIRRMPALNRKWASERQKFEFTVPYWQQPRHTPHAIDSLEVFLGAEKYFWGLI
jgi:hypothetical protein